MTEKLPASMLLKQVRTTKGRLFAMFAEMKGMLAANLHKAAHVTTGRALDAFVTRFSSSDLRDFVNASKFMDDLSSAATALMNTVQLASSTQHSQAGEVAR